MDVLFSEVAGPARWGQFNLKLGWVQPFFGMPLAAPVAINLVQLNATGNIIANHAAHPMYKPNSSNWAFEIPGASDLIFPGVQSRPIIIIAQMQGGQFAYELVMPNEAPYSAVRGFLYHNRQTPDRELARCIVARAAVPNNHFGLDF